MHFKSNYLDFCINLLLQVIKKQRQISSKIGLIYLQRKKLTTTQFKCSHSPILYLTIFQYNEIIATRGRYICFDAL